MSSGFSFASSIQEEFIYQNTNDIPLQQTLPTPTLFLIACLKEQGRLFLSCLFFLFSLPLSPFPFPTPFPSPTMVRSVTLYCISDLTLLQYILQSNKNLGL